MKFVMYTATPGLDRFPETQRFRVYCSACKQLMREDAAFRRRVLRFRLSIFATTAVFIALTSLPLRFTWPAGIEIVSFVIALVAYLVYVLFASFRVQEFQNERVARLLQNHAA
jgi:hypothetical protein